MKFESVPGFLFHAGKKYVCPCGNDEFQVEVGSSPVKFWCECGAWYTEYIVGQLCHDSEGQKKATHYGD